MTLTAQPLTGPPLASRLRAARAVRFLPPPAERRAIREEARLSREDIARELRAQGLKVTAGAVQWWEKEKHQGGFDPRPAKALAYGELLDRIKREVDSWLAEQEEPQK